MAALSPWPAHFLTLARYHAWATQRLLDAVAALDDEAYRRDLRALYERLRPWFESAPIVPTGANIGPPAGSHKP